MISSIVTPEVLEQYSHYMNLNSESNGPVTCFQPIVYQLSSVPSPPTTPHQFSQFVVVPSTTPSPEATPHRLNQYVAVPSTTSAPETTPYQLSPVIAAQSTSSTSPKTDGEDYGEIDTLNVKDVGRARRTNYSIVYQKIKKLRKKSQEVTCHECRVAVETTEEKLIEHIQLHEDFGQFMCRLCGFQANLRRHVVAHIFKEHPEKKEDTTRIVADNRNFEKLIEQFSTCFPSKRSKGNRSDNVGAYLQLVKTSTDARAIKCNICSDLVDKQIIELLKHVKQHSYRCNLCKCHITSLEGEVKPHLKSHNKDHEVMNRSMFTLCAANQALARTATIAFPLK